MIDGIKFIIDPESVRYSDILEFKPNGNRQTARYNGLTVDLYNHSCYVRGSIHKYSNSGIHNADDFTLSRFIATLHDLCLTLNIKPESSLFQSIEFGVNVQLPFEVKKFINSIIFCRNGLISKNKLGIEVQFSEYRIKLYLKALNGSPDKLRYEVAISKTRRTRNITKGHVTYCNTLADLTNSKLWDAFGIELLSVYDDIILVDVESIDWKELNEKEVELWINGQNAGYWLKEWPNNKTKKRHLERFKAIVNKYAKYDMKKEVRALISDKINTLIDVKTEPIYTPEFHILYNDEVSTNHHWCKIDENIKVSTNHQRCKTGENIEMSVYHTLDERGLKDTTNTSERLCEITNLSLEIGIKQGRYLSAKGVEYYYQNKRDIYDEVLNKRLPERWENKPLKIQFREIAHSIRNEKFNPKNNPRNNLKTSIEKRLTNGGLLFDMAEMIRPDKREILRGCI